ncbi:MULTISPECIES: hypothetical protein [unclassified Microcoleus]|uniref:hypothetical protein n=1 Tax=unclassified Microcoleus TaxID=2642155 RepID=UPI001DA6936A|nr:MULTISPECIES: hypothetical protein [unclassified Microcoleus]MCC3600064.1 hypothetical protein [Microcoleus sp. PH2017_26_ELK_O_A]MCC3625082.1 hypothetical protein [Microcoleus sp. PH2017_36_ELK_O_B]
MKYKSLLSLTLSLAIVVAGGFAPIPAIAEPDPAFKPIIGEIRNKLPSNLVFRLPSLLPRAVTRKMSLKLTFDANSERAHLDLEDENCPTRFNNKGSRAYELVCRLFSVTSSTLTSTYYQRNQIKPGSRTTAVQLSRNLRGYHLQGLDWSKVSWIQDNIYFQIYSAVPANQLIEVARSMVAESQVINGRVQNVTQQPKSRLITWREFVEQGGGRYIQVDYDLPPEFRNGYVYFNQGASVITAYILKQGLSSYPPLNVGGLGEIDVTNGDRYVQSGKAIVFSWNVGNSSLRFANDTQVTFTEKGTGCFRANCLTAPFMTNEQISRILRSKKPIPQKK